MPATNSAQGNQQVGRLNTKKDLWLVKRKQENLKWINSKLVHDIVAMHQGFTTGLHRPSIPIKTLLISAVAWESSSSILGLASLSTPLLSWWVSWESSSYKDNDEGPGTNVNNEVTMRSRTRDARLVYGVKSNYLLNSPEQCICDSWRCVNATEKANNIEAGKQTKYTFSSHHAQVLDALGASSRDSLPLSMWKNWMDSGMGPSSIQEFVKTCHYHHHQEAELCWLQFLADQIQTLQSPTATWGKISSSLCHSPLSYAASDDVCGRLPSKSLLCDYYCTIAPLKWRMPSITSVWSPLPKFSASMLLTRFQSGLPSSSGNRCSPQHSSQWLMKTIFPWHTHGVERVAAKELTKPDHQEGKNGRITIVFQNGINVLYKDDSRSPCVDLRPPEFWRQLTLEM